MPPRSFRDWPAIKVCATRFRFAQSQLTRRVSREILCRSLAPIPHSLGVFLAAPICASLSGWLRRKPAIRSRTTPNGARYPRAAHRARPRSDGHAGMVPRPRAAAGMGLPRSHRAAEQARGAGPLRAVVLPRGDRRGGVQAAVAKRPISALISIHVSAAFTAPRVRRLSARWHAIVDASAP
jgi:hypothetical protein